MASDSPKNGRSEALDLLCSQRPRNVGWFQAAGLLFGDWGTSRLYVLGLAFLVAGRSSLWLIMAMSLLILVVGWAYTHICRLYPDGGGVYSAGKRRARILGVVGALLLFADYTVTASLSAVEAFHYFGLGASRPAAVVHQEPGDQIVMPKDAESASSYAVTDLKGPAVWAIIAILAIGAFNLLGPKHTSGYAVFTGAGMVLITLLIVGFALPQIQWSKVNWGAAFHHPVQLWHGFVYIVLALSGVEAIANLTGVMRKPIFQTARKSIWTVALEVALLNLLLAVAMVWLASSEPFGREAHKEDMLAFMARAFVGPAGEWLVRILGGLLLLSATNTAVSGLMSIIYVMSRDGEMPAIFQKLNAFGSPWICAILAAVVPASVLLFAHDLETLASLYAIGVVGAVAINTALAGVHPRLRRPWRKVAMLVIALVLGLIWITLALTKWHALQFVIIVLVGGLGLRVAAQIAAWRRGRPSLLRQAIMDQLTPEALARPRIMLATAGSDDLAEPAVQQAKALGATLVVCFVREVALSYKFEVDQKFSLDTDPAAVALFREFLEHGHRAGVPIMPAYDTGRHAAEIVAETAAMTGAQKVLIGSSRRGAVHYIIRGSFQRHIESFLPPSIPVEVVSPAIAPKSAPAEVAAE